MASFLRFLFIFFIISLHCASICNIFLRHIKSYLNSQPNSCCYMHNNRTMQIQLQRGRQIILFRDLLKLQSIFFDFCIQGWPGNSKY